MEKRRKFTREFKLEAVRLIKERGVSYAQASEDLGVHPTQLRNWVKQLADDPQHAFCVLKISRLCRLPLLYIRIRPRCCGAPSDHSEPLMPQASIHMPRNSTLY